MEFSLNQPPKFFHQPLVLPFSQMKTNILGDENFAYTTHVRVCGLVGYTLTRRLHSVNKSPFCANVCQNAVTQQNCHSPSLPFPTNTPRHTYVHLVKGVFFFHLPAGEALFAVDWKVLTEHWRFIICHPNPTVSYRPLTALEHRGGELAGRTIYVCLWM